MRAVTSRDGRVELVERPAPRLERDGAARPAAAEDDLVVLDVTSAGICASDLHLVGMGVSGVILGHEFGGHLPDGTLVAVRPTGSCGVCRSCTSARPQVCRHATGRMHGTAIDGGLAEQVLVERSRVVPLPTGVDPRDAALLEPLAVAVHGVERSGAVSGDRVLVIGAGSIGLLTAAAFAHRGIGVTVSARHPHQREVALQLGASLEVDRDYDIVVDAVSTQDSTDMAIAACRAGGTLLELGMFWQPVSFGNQLLLKEISVVPSIFYAHDHDRGDFGEAAEMLHRRPELPELVVTHRLPLERAVEAFALAASRSSGVIKVHLHP